MEDTPFSSLNEYVNLTGIFFPTGGGGGGVTQLLLGPGANVSKAQSTYSSQQ